MGTVDRACARPPRADCDIAGGIGSLVGPVGSSPPGRTRRVGGPSAVTSLG